jgi:hypothetical protein
MLNIDNAVELMMKTYLGLPKKATGIPLSRAQIDALDTFPKLVAALEDHAPEKLQGLDSVEIEWYHRLRNQLYHNGNGLTVERAKALAYGESARLLFRNLFGGDISIPDTDAADPLWSSVRSFIIKWRELEVELERLADYAASSAANPIERHGIRPTLTALRSNGVLDKATVIRINRLNVIRHDIAHGTFSYAEQLSDAIDDLAALIRQLEQIDRPSP